VTDAARRAEAERAAVRAQEDCRQDDGPAVFRFLLRDADEEPNDPAVFVTAVHNWMVGEALLTGDGARFRIIGIEGEDAPTLAEHGLSAIFTVERA